MPRCADRLGEDDVTDRGLRFRRGPLRWWLFVVLVLATAALLMVGRDAPVRALDAQPVVDPAPPATLTNLRAI